MGAAYVLMALTSLVACSDDGADDIATTSTRTATTVGGGATTSVGNLPSTTPAPSVLATDSAPATSDAAPDTTADASSAVSAEALSWALEYTAGTAGAASGEPVVIGVADFAEYPADPYTSAMAEFVNAELGGIDGRPIEIVQCDGEQDPAGCAEQLAGNPDVVAVLENLLDTKDEFQLALAGRKPILSIDPFLGTESVSFFTGALQTLTATGLVAGSLLDDGAGRIAIIGGIGVDVVIGPALDLVAPDADVVRVAIPEPGDDTTFDVDALLLAIEAAGAADVDVVVGYAPVACDIAVDAWEQLGARPAFVWPTWCDGPDGRVVGEQVDFASPDVASGELTVVEALRASLPSSTDLEREGGVLLWPAADLLLLTRVLNDIGVDDAATELEGALTAYDGPVLFGVGDADCTARPPTLTTAEGACTTLVEVTERTDGLIEIVDPVDLNQ